jgi:hypothetical protein
MNEERYHKLRYNADYTIFIFASTGRHGDLLKIVSFDEIDDFSNTYNLALGTLLPGGDVDYNSITNNGDRNKVLATVAQIINIFMEQHPGRTVYIKGSDQRRTILYQRAINYGYDELIKLFNIYGEISTENEEYELFEKSKRYSGFLIEKKGY